MLSFKQADKLIPDVEPPQARERGHGYSDDYDALLEDAKGIPFWYTGEDHEQKRKETQTDRGNSTCCYWDLIGRPIKHNEEKPVFDYQQITLAAIQYFMNVRIKKFRGAGMTKLLLDIPAWMTLFSNQYRRKQAFVITGITQRLANKHIKRLRDSFMEYYPGAIEYMEYSTKTLTINESLFEAFPQGNPDAARGETDVFYLMADEFDFPTRRIQEESMATIRPFRPKEDAFVILNSTTKRQTGLYKEMDEEWKEFLHTIGLSPAEYNQRDLLLEDKPEYMQQIKAEARHVYPLLEFDVNWGLGQIYTQSEIDEVRGDRTFAGEFLLNYSGTVGNVFSWHDVDYALDLGDKYESYPVNQYNHHFGGIDPGWGKITPVYVWEVMKAEEIVRLVHVELFDNNATPGQVAKWAHNYWKGFLNLWWMLDGADRGFVNQMKTQWNEDQDWVNGDDVNPQQNIVIPVNFQGNHKRMLENLFMLLSEGHLAIPRSIGYRLETAFKTAWAEGWNLDKDETDNDDDLDATQVALKEVSFGNE